MAKKLRPGRPPFRPIERKTQSLAICLRLMASAILVSPLQLSQQLQFGQGAAENYQSCTSRSPSSAFQDLAPSVELMLVP
jgi:hypothetical protein